MGPIQTRRGYSPWLTGAAVGLATVSNLEKAHALVPGGLSGAALFQPIELGGYRFGHDGVLGTSLDLWIETSRPADAHLAEQHVLAEIARLSRILSTYDPSSEINRVAAGEAVESSELAELLAAYQLWNERTHGVIEINLARVIELWKVAARTGQPPSPDALEVAAMAGRSWNVDALGKGFVIDRAVAVARRFASAGGLNIGGDLRVWGAKEWLIGVADPRNPSENAPLLATFPLREAAVATSGGYARYFSVAGRRYSHLIDPRSRQPVDTLRSATFIAPDALTANALATAASIAGYDHPRSVAQFVGASGGLVVEASGEIQASGVLRDSRPVSAAAAAWPSNYQVAINLSLKVPVTGRTGGPGGRGGSSGAKRPYVAVWIEDAAGLVVRNIALWGTEGKYHPELSSWWRKVGGSKAIVQSVSRATRSFGAYTLNWDGRNDSGGALPLGAYTICVEINREHGGHVTQRATINCLETPASAALKVTAESEATQVVYGTPNAVKARSRQDRFRQVVAWSRTIHIYLTMLGLLVIVLFGVTGFTISHEDWFGATNPVLREEVGATPAELIAASNSLGIVEHVRNTFRLRGAVTSYDSFDEQITIAFKSPDEIWEIVIEKPGGRTTAHHEMFNFAALVNNLHRGRYAGAAWRWIIDLSALLIVLACVTGFFLWLALPRRRRAGIAFLALGTLGVLLVFYWLVPGPDAPLPAPSALSLPR